MIFKKGLAHAKQIMFVEICSLFPNLMQFKMAKMFMATRVIRNGMGVAKKQCRFGAIYMPVVMACKNLQQTSIQSTRNFFKLFARTHGSNLYKYCTCCILSGNYSI